MPARNVLANVPKIGFWPATKCPEDLPFAACLRSLAEFLGDERFGCRESRPEDKSRPIPCVNKFFVGLSGIGFAMGWKWQLGAFSVLNLDENPGAHIERCFTALGFGCSILANPQHPLGARLTARGVKAAGPDELRQAVRSSVDRGMPCLAFGVFPPPEPCVVTGYDDDGAVLIGWSQFQDFPAWKGETGYEPCGYFSRSDWVGKTACVVIPGEKLRESPSLEELVHEAVRDGLRLMERTDAVDGFVGGIRGYQALIDALRDPGAFPEGDDALLRERFEVVDGITGEIAEAKCYVADFLGMVGEGAGFLLARANDPAAREAARRRIVCALGRFLVIHDLMWKVWEEERGDSLTISWPVREHRYLGRPAVREKIARIFEAAKAAEIQAHDYLAEALRIIDGTARPEPLPDPVVLPRVGYIGFDASRTGGKPRTTYMAAALESLLGAIGDPYPYHYLMGVSGAAFRLSWNVERWDGGSISTLCIDDDPLDHYRRAFAATGWQVRFLGNRRWKPPVAESERTNSYLGVDYLGDKVEYSDDPEEFRHLVRWGVAERQSPLITIGTILPPEAGVICGYRARDDALIGYHHFQVFPENTSSPDVSFDAEGRFVKRNWFADTIALIGLQNKGPKPALADTCRDALRTALRLIRTPRFRRHWSGLAAYRAWADALEEPWGAEVLADSDEMKLRLMCHNDALACILDGRTAAEEFVREAAAVLPAHGDVLRGVASHYAEVAALARRMIEIQGGFRGDAEPLEAIARPGKRRTLASVIRQAGEIEERIAAALEPVCAATP